MSPRAGKRHNLISQIHLCALSRPGVCSVQGESEMRGIVPSFLDVGTNPKSSLCLQLAADLTLRHDRSRQEGEKEAMRRQLTNLAFVALAVAILSFTSVLSLTSVAYAGSETLDYRCFAGAGEVGEPFAPGVTVCDFGVPCPDVATASNGDTIEIAGEGTLSVHPKSVTGSGSFTHNFAAGGSVSGTWTATQLLSFKSYGSSPAAVGLPPTWEAGKAIIRVQLFVGGNPVATGTLTVGCILPEVEVPGGAFEGSTLNVHGGPNFNKADVASTLFILQS